MPLNLIAGPPNSARAASVIGGFRESLQRRPLLVVPTSDDAEHFERELTEDGAALGASILTFGGLFSELARAYEHPWEAGMTRAQRIWLARCAVRRAGAGALSGSASRPGFAPALADLIEEIESVGLDPETFTSHAAKLGDYEHDLARLYEAWAGLRDEHGLPDRHRLAEAVIAAVRGDRDGVRWGGRPVFLYGFDDLTAEQLELVGALAAVTDVTVAVTYEDRLALRARARLLADLRGVVPAEKLGSEVRLETDPETTPNRLLRQIEQGFLAVGAGRAEPNDGLSLLRAAGERSEAELVGAEVAKLLAASTAPDEIAVVLRSPARSGALWDEVFRRLGIPTAVEASLPLRATSVGRALGALARLAAGNGTAEDLVAYLREPGRAPSGQVDRLERAVRRDGMRAAAEAEEFWERQERTRDLFELADLRETRGGAALVRTAARLARMLAEYPVRREAALPGADRSLELRAASAAERALLEVAELDPEGLGPAELVELLESVSVRLHEGMVTGRVRILSPYRLRARRVQHLFVCSLQDGEFPRRNPASPLIPDDRRGELGLTKRSEPEDEERYLFAICLSRPERGLSLSWRETDDEGKPLARSPFVDEVRDLIAPEQPEDPDEPDPLLRSIGRERGPGDVVLDVADASSPTELARALAARGREHWRGELEAIEVPAETAAPIAARLEAASEATAPRRLAPFDLRSAQVLETLGGIAAFGGTTLEEYARCSYRWFVGHELSPQRLDPTDEPLVLGGLAHRALEQLYRERPGGTPRPTPETLAAWKARARVLVEEDAEDSDLPRSDPMVLAQIRRVEGLIAAYLTDEAASERTLAPQPDLLEAAFGRNGGEDDEAERPPPLELTGGFRLHGSIDRVDVADTSAGRVGLVHDYKLSREVTKGADFEDEGKLQLQLYALALRRLWEIEPVGGVYVPLRGTDQSGRRPRGIVRADLADLLPGLEVVGKDRVDPEEFEETLAAAEARASQIAASITGGRVRRDPLGGECPSFCRWQTICRRERGMEEPDDVVEQEEDEP